MIYRHLKFRAEGRDVAAGLGVLREAGKGVPSRSSARERRGGRSAVASGGAGGEAGEEGVEVGGGADDDMGDAFGGFEVAGEEDEFGAKDGAAVLFEDFG